MIRHLRHLLLAPWPARVVRWSLGGIFLYAGILKLQYPEAFGIIINDFGLVPENWIMPLAVGLPLLEVVAALGLIAGLRGALATTTGLLLLFIAVLAYALWQGLDIDCGCFGPSDPEYRAYRGLWTALYRDLAMLTGVVYLYGRVALRRRTATQEYKQYMGKEKK